MDDAALILRHEGRRRFLYRDSEGVLTIAVGWNIQGRGLPNDIIDRLFALSLAEARDTAGRIFGFAYDPANPRHAALGDMAFELGEGGLRAFVQLRACVEHGDWNGAAAAALDSKYARQVPSRADEIATLLRTGSWNSLPAATNTVDKPVK